MRSTVYLFHLLSLRTLSSTPALRHTLVLTDSFPVLHSACSQPIPLEIQLLVADNADRPTLASLMRVTKALHRDVSPLFFRTLVIRSLAQAKELKD